MPGLRCSSTLMMQIVFPGGDPNTQSDCNATSELTRLLLHRLDVLRAALDRVAELEQMAAHSGNRGKMQFRRSAS